MKGKIPTGSYVIRNKQTSTVLHVDNPNPTSNTALSEKWSVTACEQNETQYPEQQVWWIEPFPSYDDTDEGITYSITNPSTGRCLDANIGGSIAHNVVRKETTQGAWRLIAFHNRAAPWQKWRIEVVSGEKDEPYYKIASVWNGEVIAISTGRDSGEAGPRCNCVEYDPGSENHSWEIIVPIVAFPPGWCQIQNSQTLGLLNHAYLANPPVLSKPPTSMLPSHYRESWGSQWTLAHIKYIFPNFKGSMRPNTWCIRNRLTGGYLGNMYNNKYPFIGNRKVGANDWEFSEEDIAEHIWRLEIDPSCTSHWKIIHDKTGFLLEGTEVPLQGGIQVACLDKKFNRGNKDKTWLLTSPLIEVAEDAPPEYKIGVGRETGSWNA